MNRIPDETTPRRWGARQARIAELRQQMDDIIAEAPQCERIVLENLRQSAEGGGVETALTLYANRRRRQAYFGDHAGLFGEPAWDILLDLYASHRNGRIVTVSSASIAACTPTTTGLRWIAEMHRLGLLQSRRHPDDRRARVVTLTPAAETAMDAYLEEVGDRSRCRCKR